MLCGMSKATQRGRRAAMVMNQPGSGASIEPRGRAWLALTAYGLAAVGYPCLTLAATGLQTHDLKVWHDAERVLANPHKGWYHHYPDNHIDKYRVAQDEDLLKFPGMDHVYMRLAWAYLEPKEGQYDWAVIDPWIAKWTRHGLGIAFRISCRETSTDRLEQQYATPRWVMEAGARGGHYRMGKATGPEGPWEPVYDDPVFLSKLDRFLEAFAARYDGRPWLRYVDIGSIGDWGEGHSWAGSRQECGLAARKAHVDLHLKHFKRALLVASDDLVYALGDRSEREALHRYLVEKGVSYRDDSILVSGYLAGSSETFTVRSPEFFGEVYRTRPTVLELEHYGTVKRGGNWEGGPGSLVAAHGKGKRGPDYFRGALALLHASYIGYHGYAHEWLADNPDLTGELLNRCGYWLFPTALVTPDRLTAGIPAAMKVAFENRGVAPPYAPYELRVKLADGNRTFVRSVGCASTAWLPGAPFEVPFEVTPPGDFAGKECRVWLGLFDRASEAGERVVEFGLKAARRDAEGYYLLTSIPLESKP